MVHYFPLQKKKSQNNFTRWSHFNVPKVKEGQIQATPPPKKNNRHTRFLKHSCLHISHENHVGIVEAGNWETQ